MHSLAFHRTAATRVDPALEWQRGTLPTARSAPSALRFTPEDRPEIMPEVKNAATTARQSRAA